MLISGLRERPGARDMIVTHLFQVPGFVAMEPPTSLDARHLREETAAGTCQAAAHRHEGPDRPAVGAVAVRMRNFRGGACR